MKIYLLLAGLAISAFCMARSVPRVETKFYPVFGDSLQAEIQSVDHMLSDIMNALGLQQNIELKKARVLNIEASVVRGRRYIVYNPRYIQWINKVSKDKWATMALLAHELGHHLNGHTIRRSGSKPQLELEADQFAGFVLYQLGASLIQSQAVMNHIANTSGSKTHPPRNSRMAAIETGWREAASQAGKIMLATK